jgi:acyl carrier protein
MHHLSQVLELLDDVLGLQGRSLSWTRDTPLLGVVAELDSMAVVSLLTAVAERFDVAIDDEVDGSTFETVGSFADFIAQRSATLSNPTGAR